MKQLKNLREGDNSKMKKLLLKKQAEIRAKQASEGTSVSNPAIISKSSLSKSRQSRVT